MNHHPCAEYKELISAFIDGELTPDERARMSGHLSICVDCRETLEVYRLIGARVRSMPPVSPPDHLIDSIFADTIDAQPRRLFIVSSRLGYSLAAIAAILLIFVVAIYLIVGGYQRGMQPSVSSTAPQNGEMWPIQNPIEITFNKPMNHSSVTAALAIIPPGEAQRLTVAWNGNTLLIGQNQTLKPGTAYEILIRGNAQDKYGNTLDNDFRLSFGTTSTVQATESPTPLPTVAFVPTRSVPTATATPVVEQPSPSATVSPAGSPTSRLPADPTATSQLASGEPTATAVEPTATSDTSTGAPEPTVEPQPTATTEPTLEPEPTDTPTLEPEPTDTPEPSPTLQATATSPATATEPIEATPTETTIPVTGGFGDVYWSDPTIQARLGAPLSAATSTGALQLGFQGGVMYYRGDISTIYVLNQGDQTWSSFLDTSTETQDPQPGPDPTLWLPGGILGHLWSAESSVSDTLGYAIDQYPASFSAQVQLFEGGIMISSPDTIWILYDDLTWEWLGNSGG